MVYLLSNGIAFIFCVILLTNNKLIKKFGLDLMLPWLKIHDYKWFLLLKRRLRFDDLWIKAFLISLFFLFSKNIKI